MNLYALIQKANRPQRVLACFALGALGALGMAPYNAWPILILCLSGFYLLIDRTGSPRGAFIYGWLFAFGYFFTGLLWVKNALLVDGNPFSWIWPLAVAGLPSLLAFFIATGAWAAKRFADLKTGAGFLAFTAFIVLVEWSRGFVLTGYPWNLFGYTWAGTPPMIQTVAVGNIYFLTWLTIFWFALPGFLLLSGPPRKEKIVLCKLAIISIAACVIFGVARLNTAVITNVPDVDIHIVQPDIDQSEKWDRSKTGQHFLKSIELSQPAEGSKNKTIIVWPETAMGFWLAEDPQAVQYITDTLQAYPGGAVLMTGMLRHEAETKSYFNSLVMFDAEGKISNVYDKYHLVPFGEYIPFQKWIPLKPVVEFTGFILGSGVKTFETFGLKYSPVICYEIIFSGKVVGPDTPDFIVNVTNDAWYGISAGPHQHFTQAVFRAVEEGIPVIRAANTGLSGLIDPLGRVHGLSPLFEQYEKTLALPHKNMIFRNNNLIKNVIFTGMVLLFTAFGYLIRRKNLASG
jgi:apolipoprotein N-acyltransferase